MSDMAALYERKAEGGISLAADLAAAISAVDLTDVLMDDAPFDTAKVCQNATIGVVPPHGEMCPGSAEYIRALRRP